MYVKKLVAINYPITQNKGGMWGRDFYPSSKSEN